MDPISIAKRNLRKKFLAQLKEMDEEDVSAISGDICQRLAEFGKLRNVSHISIYASMGNEPDLSPFAFNALDRGIKVYYPRFNRKKQEFELALRRHQTEKLVKGYMNIFEPRPNAETVKNHIKNNEVRWLVPGIAFDKMGHRLGRGKGYYDRLLRGTKGIKIGIAYDWQVIDEVPVNSADVSMDYLVTGNDHLRCIGELLLEISHERDHSF